MLALLGWALFAALAPTVLGIDHAGLASIYKAGDHTAFNLTLHSGARYPLKTLAPTAAAVGLLALLRDAPGAQRTRTAARQTDRRRGNTPATRAQRVIDPAGLAAARPSAALPGFASLSC